ncbi:MAG: polysaccharide deacetylase family protein [Armatimonadetes bacterium]|nr:polysaccharide deacetylase family protein [Armatimonadota bacterium]
MNSAFNRLLGGVILVTALSALLLTGCGRRSATDADAGAAAQAPEQAELPPRTIPVFCYHKISAEPSTTYEVSTADFKEQLAVLAEEGYETVTPAQIADYLEGKADLPEKPVCITFDDGYKSVLEICKPAMEKYNYVGTAFLISSSVCGRGNLDWDDVAELEQAGWEIGAHTVSHIHPTWVSVEKCAEEFEQSRATIREHIEGDCTAIAYPYGLYDDDVLRVTREAGYRIGFTIDRGPADQTDDPLLIPREMVVNGNSMKTFKRWLHQEKLHLADLDPPPGAHFDTRTPSITATLADDGVPPGEIEFTVAGKRVDVDVADDGVSLTLRPKLSKGANIIRANYWGSPQRETSWVITCDAE